MEIGMMYDEYKPLLFTLAYQLTGTSSDAEDIVQDVFVKLHQVDLSRLENTKAYLCKMVTNQCLDYLISARKQREQYIGTWLPEPIKVSKDEQDQIIMNDLLSYALLVLLEKLTPVERAIYVLREAFAFDYQSIAGMVEKSEVNARKIYSRAKGKLGIPQGGYSTSNLNHRMMDSLLFSLQEGNVEQLLSLLAEDITVYSDGGGKVPAALYPVQSSERVLRFLMGLMKRLPYFGEDTRIVEQMLNGDLALLVLAENNVILAVLFEMQDNLLKNIFFVRNPDKLERLNDV
ncbi:RNA polymerase sigma factor SigJ [Ornithinibacillus scapharcae]|uniref:RNA polymerase sigma factor SigJ n=1 Tax=Ornithinibacillus scapharcae TaxID=1147159 RepID=UPI000225B01F|nr:RNA polymerase sigma factor SigJ [Ornithinibacillus scapharcae]